MKLRTTAAQALGARLARQRKSIVARKRFD